MCFAPNKSGITFLKIVGRDLKKTFFFLIFISLVTFYGLKVLKIGNVTLQVLKSNAKMPSVKITKVIF